MNHLPRRRSDPTTVIAALMLGVGFALGAACQAHGCVSACDAQVPPTVLDRPVALAGRRNWPRPVPQRVDLTAELVVARACAKEGGLFPAAGQTFADHVITLRDDCALVHAVYARGALRAHQTLQAFARNYSPHVFTPGGENPWIADLAWGDHRPALWPSESRLWEADESRHCRARPETCRPNGISHWDGVRALAAQAVAGRLPHACPAPPDDWGGHMDRLRGVASGLVRMRCGNALNDGWIRPGLHSAAEVAAARASIVEPVRVAGHPVDARAARGRR